MGNTYYYNQLTNETKWMPPCQKCNKDMGRKICQDCDYKVYCQDCFDRVHADLPVEHIWKAADIDKEELKPGEKYCVKCHVTAARRCCKTCRDAYCERCYRDVHAVGWLSKHSWVSWEDFKKGWQEVKGRVDGERDYYFNATTSESTYEKPEELMIEEELKEYKLHVKFRTENDKNLKRIEKLTEKVAQYQYEKDQLWFEINMKKSADAEELEMLRNALLEKEAGKRDKLKKMILHPVAFYQDWLNEKKKNEQLYRRKLLLSAKQRKEVGLEKK